MITKRNDNRTILHIGAAVAVLLFMAALFVGAGAAISWNTLSTTLTSGTYTIDDIRELQLNQKGTITITGDVTIEFDPSYTYNVKNVSSSTTQGGIINQISFSNADSSLTIKNLHIKGGSVSGGEKVGGLVGTSTGSGKVVFENCTISNVLVSGSSKVGGLVGSAIFVKADGCKVEMSAIKASGEKVGGLVGNAESTSPTIDLQRCTVADSVIYAKTGYCGGIIGFCGCNSDLYRLFTCNTVRNCLIYSDASSPGGAVGGVIGQCVGTTSQTCSSNTVEFCTIADAGNIGAGGIAGKFPTIGILSGNKVFNTCIVSKNGAAAGICPTVST